MFKDVGPERAIEQIHQGLSWWLLTEAKRSTNDRNRVLDELNTERASVYRETNFVNAKFSSHSTRLLLWLAEQEKTQDSKEWNQFAANVTFGALMSISGAYRKQAIIQATDQDDYYNRKLLERSKDQPLTIDLRNAIATKLDEMQEFPKSRTLLAAGTEAVKETEITNNKMILILRNKDEEVYGPQSEAAGLAVEQQKIWTDFCVQSIAAAAFENDGLLGRVPVLEPKSISDSPKVIYPFSQSG